jgi:hypothetical protein
MADNFRKRFGSLQDWHFRSDCPDWPQAEYAEQTDHPSENEVCVECVRLQSDENIASKNQVFKMRHDPFFSEISLRGALGKKTGRPGAAVSVDVGHENQHADNSADH